MDCGEVKRRLYSFIDYELNYGQMRDVEKHISGCERCASLVEDEKKADALISKSVPRVEAPAALKARVLGSLEGAAGSGSRVPLSKPAVAAAMSVVILASVLFSLFPRRDGMDLLAEAAADHRDFLRGYSGAEISSGNPSEITGWLEEKLDYEISAPDLSGGGYYIAGARLPRLGKQNSACFVYRKESSYISLYMLDAADPELPGTGTASEDGLFYSVSRAGHQCVLHVREESGAAMLFISDLPALELLEIIKTGL